MQSCLNSFVLSRVMPTTECCFAIFRRFIACLSDLSPQPLKYFNAEFFFAVCSSRYLIYNMTQGSVLRIEPVRPDRDDTEFTCVASNGVGRDDARTAHLEVVALTSGGE